MTMIREAILDWGPENLSDLATILKINDFKGSIDEIEEAFKWLYHSKNRAKVKSGVNKLLTYASSKVKGESVAPDNESNSYSTPSYDELVIQASKELKVYREGKDISVLATYISESVITSAMSKMDPSARHRFFTEELDAKKVFHDADIKDRNLTGPKTAAALIVAANSAGFGLYTTATTALGFATHAIGITLPFAAYTGLTSSIAFVLGPAGWLAAGTWAFLKLTGAEWKELIPALLHITSINSYKDMLNEIDHE